MASKSRFTLLLMASCAWSSMESLTSWLKKVTSSDITPSPFRSFDPSCKLVCIPILHVEGVTKLGNEGNLYSNRRKERIRILHNSRAPNRRRLHPSNLPRRFPEWRLWPRRSSALKDVQGLELWHIQGSAKKSSPL